jgi:excisionase family DNA binding protein
MRESQEGHIMTLHGLAEIAAYLRVSRSTVHRWITDYQMPAVKAPSGRYMVTESMLEQWMMNLRTVQVQTGEIPACPQRKP